MVIQKHKRPQRFCSIDFDGRTESLGFAEVPKVSCTSVFFRYMKKSSWALGAKTAGRQVTKQA